MNTKKKQQPEKKLTITDHGLPFMKTTYSGAQILS